MPFFVYKNKYYRLYFANWCPSKLGKFFSEVDLYCYAINCLFPVRCTIFKFFLLAGVRRKDGDLWHSCGPLQPQFFGREPRILAAYHQLQTGQRILPSLQSSVPWEYKLKYLHIHDLQTGQKNTPHSAVLIPLGV